jgi:hypothetical protein
VKGLPWANDEREIWISKPSDCLAATVKGGSLFISFIATQCAIHGHESAGVTQASRSRVFNEFEVFV